MQFQNLRTRSGLQLRWRICKKVDSKNTIFVSDLNKNKFLIVSPVFHPDLGKPHNCLTVKGQENGGIFPPVPLDDTAIRRSKLFHNEAYYY